MRELLGQPWPRISVRVDYVRVNQSMSLCKDALNFMIYLPEEHYHALTPSLPVFRGSISKKDIGRNVVEFDASLVCQ